MDALLTMEAEAMRRGSGEARFSPCFPDGCAPCRTSRPSSLTLHDGHRATSYLSPKPVPKNVSSVAVSGRRDGIRRTDREKHH
jgi:hypothetical protein